MDINLFILVFEKYLDTFPFYNRLNREYVKILIRKNEYDNFTELEFIDCFKNNKDLAIIQELIITKKNIIKANNSTFKNRLTSPRQIKMMSTKAMSVSKGLHRKHPIILAP